MPESTRFVQPPLYSAISDRNCPAQHTPGRSVRSRNSVPFLRWDVLRERFPSRPEAREHPLRRWWNASRTSHTPRRNSACESCQICTRLHGLEAGTRNCFKTSRSGNTSESSFLGAGSAALGCSVCPAAGKVGLGTAVSRRATGWKRRRAFSGFIGNRNTCRYPQQTAAHLQTRWALR
jgi:hypothetical protein